METTARANGASEMEKQYSLGKILGIWALTAVPMDILSWIIFPAVSPDFNSDPLRAGVTRFVLLLNVYFAFLILGVGRTPPRAVSERGQRADDT